MSPPASTQVTDKSKPPKKTFTTSFKDMVSKNFSGAKQDLNHVFNHHNGEDGFQPIDSADTTAYSQGESSTRNNKPS